MELKKKSKAKKPALNSLFGAVVLMEMSQGVLLVVGKALRFQYGGPILRHDDITTRHC